jgi:hypothetical protein
MPDPRMVMKPIYVVHEGHTLLCWRPFLSKVLLHCNCCHYLVLCFLCSFYLRGTLRIFLYSGLFIEFVEFVTTLFRLFICLICWRLLSHKDCYYRLYDCQLIFIKFSHTPKANPVIFIRSPGPPSNRLDTHTTRKNSCFYQRFWRFKNSEKQI